MSSKFDRITTQHAESISAETQTYLPIMVKRIMRSVKTSQKLIVGHISSILGAYGIKGGFESKEEALRFLNLAASSETRNELLQAIMSITDDDDMRRKLLAWYDARATKGRLTNRQVLSDVITVEAKRLGLRIDKTMTEGLSAVVGETVDKSAYSMAKAVGTSISFTQPNREQIIGILHRNYSPAYSEILANGYGRTVKEQIIGGLLAGDDVHAISRKVASATESELWKAKRFVRTEITMSSNAAEIYHFKRAGYTQYRYHATFDERTCPRCGQMHGKIIDIDDRQQGKNFPPLHENCRCHITAILDDDDITEQKRRAKDGNGKYVLVPADMTFAEYKKRFLSPPS